MIKRLAVSLATIGIVGWALRDKQELGERLRRRTDGPTNPVLLGTFGLEREGRDPAKSP